VRFGRKLVSTFVVIRVLQLQKGRKLTPELAELIEDIRVESPQTIQKSKPRESIAKIRRSNNEKSATKFERDLYNKKKSLGDYLYGGFLVSLLLDPTSEIGKYAQFFRAKVEGGFYDICDVIDVNITYFLPEIALNVVYLDRIEELRILFKLPSSPEIETRIEMTINRLKNGPSVLVKVLNEFLSKVPRTDEICKEFIQNAKNVVNDALIDGFYGVPTIVFRRVINAINLQIQNIDPMARIVTSPTTFFPTKISPDKLVNVSQQCNVIYGERPTTQDLLLWKEKDGTTIYCKSETETRLKKLCPFKAGEIEYIYDNIMTDVNYLVGEEMVDFKPNYTAKELQDKGWTMEELENLIRSKVTNKSKFPINLGMAKLCLRKPKLCPKFLDLFSGMIDRDTVDDITKFVKSKREKQREKQSVSSVEE
jgi:hypothetical protein